MTQEAKLHPLRDTYHYRILFAILLGGLLVRIWGIWQYQYSGDEMEFLLIAKGDTLREVWRRGLAELHPPLAHFIRHYLLLLTPDIMVQRLCSVFAGMLSIMGLYRFGAQLRGPFLGLVCALLMAFMPVAVSTSMTIRNYAFFMAFLSWGLYYFVRYQQSENKKDLSRTTLLFFLASLTHFSGFIVAAACGLCTGWNLLRTKRWLNLLHLCSAFIPLGILGVFLYLHYLAPGAAGPMWQKFITQTGIPKDSAGGLDNTAIKLFVYFIPFLGILSEHAQAQYWVQALMLASTALLILFYLAGLVRIYRQSPHVCFLLLVTLALTVVASIANLYPFSPSRHSYYFLPFFILPFAYLLEPLGAFTVSKRICNTACVLILLMSAGLAYSGCYLRYDDEFALKRHDYAYAQEYLNANLKPDDLIVTGRIAAYFYLLDTKYNGSVPYDPYGEVPYFNNTKLLAPFDPPFKPYHDWHAFHDSLVTAMEQHAVQTKTNIWFVMVAYKNTEILHLMECDTLQKNNFFSRDGVVIFSVTLTALKALLEDSSQWQKCFADYRPSIVSDTFTTYPLPRNTGSRESFSQ